MGVAIPRKHYCFIAIANATTRQEESAVSSLFQSIYANHYEQVLDEQGVWTGEYKLRGTTNPLLLVHTHLCVPFDCSQRMTDIAAQAAQYVPDIQTIWFDRTIDRAPLDARMIAEAGAGGCDHYLIVDKSGVLPTATADLIPMFQATPGTG